VEARFGYYANATAARFVRYLNSAGAVVSATALPPATRELVKIRASQINGCAACTDMPTKDDNDQFAALVSLIALINACDRMNVVTRQPPATAKPGQWG